MASTYSDRLKLELMATGANANTWGTNTNNNLDVIDAFAAGYLSKSVAGSANITLTTANASDTAESSNKTIELTGNPFSTPWANVVTGASNTWTEVNAA